VRDVVVWSEELITPPARKIYIVAEVIWILREEGGGGLGLKSGASPLNSKENSGIKSKCPTMCNGYSWLNIC
jgi:hypothetical protein